MSVYLGTRRLSNAVQGHDTCHTSYLKGQAYPFDTGLGFGISKNQSAPTTFTPLKLHNSFNNVVDSTVVGFKSLEKKIVSFLPSNDGDTGNYYGSYLSLNNGVLVINDSMLAAWPDTIVFTFDDGTKQTVKLDVYSQYNTLKLNMV